MACDVVVAVGASASFGFVSRANSADLAADTPEFYRSFEGNYQPMAKAWDERIAGQPIRITQMRPPVTGPPSLPDGRVTVVAFPTALILWRRRAYRCHDLTNRGPTLRSYRSPCPRPSCGCGSPDRVAPLPAQRACCQPQK